MKLKKFESFNKTKWTGIITAIVAAIGAIAESIFNIIDKF